MTLYLDTSALLKLYVDEEGRAFVGELVAAATVVGTSLITWVESHAAFARRRRTGDLVAGQHRRVVEDLASDWERYLRLEITEVLVREAATLAAAHRLRAYDSIHLASALALRARVGDQTTFLSWDDELDSAASRERLRVPPRR